MTWRSTTLDSFRRLNTMAHNLLFVLMVSLVFISGCLGSPNLRSYSDPSGTFSFAYPNGMVPVEVTSDQEPVLIFRDLIYTTENVNLMVSPFEGADQIQQLGDAQEVGRRVADKILAPPNSGRNAQLLKAGQMEKENKTYYLLEFATQLPSQSRHDMVAVTISRHRLYTLTASTLESRWPQVKQAFYAVAQSFQVI